MLRPCLLIIALLLCLLQARAQVKSNVKLGIETGFLLRSESENLGILLRLEPKLKVSKHNFMGVRFAMTLNTQAFQNSDSLLYRIDRQSDNALLSFVPTYDYYLNDDSDLRPYLGLGIGYHIGPNAIDIIGRGQNNPDAGPFVVDVESQVSLLIRSGIESKKIRIGIEYNFIQKATIESPSGQRIGKVDNSHLAFSIGYMIGAQY